MFIFYVIIIDLRNFTREGISKGWSKQKIADEYMKKFKERYLKNKQLLTRFEFYVILIVDKEIKYEVYKERCYTYQ